MKQMMKLTLLAALGLTVMGADAALAKGKKHKAAQETVAEDKDTDMQIPHKGEKPLMVVRFNQDAVPYEWPLYNTLSKALEVKPQAQFDVVSVAPRSHDLAQKNGADTASEDLTKVLATLKEIGMPDDRFSVIKTYDEVPSSEVRIYVH